MGLWGQTVNMFTLSWQHIFGLASKEYVGENQIKDKVRSVHLELTAELFRESDFSRAALKLAHRRISLLKLQQSIIS